MMGPRNKAEFYFRWTKGEFGNRPQSWNSIELLEASNYRGKVSVRSTTPGGRLLTNMDVSQLLKNKNNFSFGCVFQESLPDDLLSIQGSLGRDSQGLWLEYCLETGIHFRIAMERSQTVKGLTACFILREYVDPSSLDDLYDLLNSFPNSVIEFASYRVNVGIFPRRKTVIFEVREY